MKEPKTITLKTRTYISAGGEIKQLTITCGDTSIMLTKEQAITLAKEIRRRFPDELPPAH